jgi:hypothetical protein
VKNVVKKEGFWLECKNCGLQNKVAKEINSKMKAAALIWKCRDHILKRYQLTNIYHSSAMITHPHIHICFVLIFFGDKTLLCSPGWPGTRDPPTSASLVLVLQTCANVPWLTHIYWTHRRASFLQGSGEGYDRVLTNYRGQRGGCLDWETVTPRKTPTMPEACQGHTQ